MSNSVLTTLVVVLAVLTAVSLTLSVIAYRAQRSRRRGSAASPLPTDVQGLRDEVVRLRAETAGALRHLAVVRYDAFGDMGGRLSWSMALVDEDGNGMVLTAIHGRSDARTYAKDINAWAGAMPLSPEEEEALTQAKAR
jgi:hypothetical protein